MILLGLTPRRDLTNRKLFYLCYINMGVLPSPKRLASAAVTAQGDLDLGDDDTKA